MIKVLQATPAPPIVAPPALCRRIADFMSQASIEATRPSAAEVQELGAILPAGAEVYLTALPNRDPMEIVETAVAVRRAGLEPVPHVAARHHADLESIATLLKRLHGEAGVTCVMLIGGDMATPLGSVRDARQVIDSGVLQDSGILEIGLPGFPDGHPVVGDDELECALVTKLAAAQSAGIDTHIVTQFCFEAEPVLNWLTRLRARGVNAPVRVGFAGPTSLMSWLSFARRCGVRASAETLAKRSGLIKQAFRSVSPDPQIRQVAEATLNGDWGEVASHIFSFGGIVSTARWTVGPARGPIELTADGFEVVGRPAPIRLKA